MTNYYEILQLSPNAEQPIIKAVYKTLMLKMSNHPDLGGSHEAAQKINEAYEHLSDPQKRMEYDSLLNKKTKHNSASSSETADTVFNRLHALEVEGYKNIRNRTTWMFDLALETPFFLKNFILSKKCPVMDSGNIDGILGVCNRTFSRQKTRWLPTGYYFLLIANGINDLELIRKKIERFQLGSAGMMERFVLVATVNDKKVRFFGKGPEHHPEDIRNLENILF